jgi:eukaryotic-like serine/threonine-protein kinase
VLAGSGDAKRAESLTQDLQKRFPFHTMVQSYWLPTIRAQIALVNREPQQAIDILQTALPVELGVPLSIQCPVCLYPVYVRGEAYLAAGQGSAAAAEFQKLIDHRGITWSCVTLALARFGLGRAYALSGNQTKRAGYLPGFVGAVERRRPRHSHPEASQRAVCEATMSAAQAAVVKVLSDTFS